MTHLTEQACVPCRGGVPPLTAGELALLLPEVPDWTLAEQDGVQRIRRDFRFRDFRGAMEFAVRVGSSPSANSITPSSTSGGDT